MNTEVINQYNNSDEALAISAKKKLSKIKTYLIPSNQKKLVKELMDNYCVNYFECTYSFIPSYFHIPEYAEISLHTSIEDIADFEKQMKINNIDYIVFEQGLRTVTELAEYRQALLKLKNGKDN